MFKIKLPVVIILLVLLILIPTGFVFANTQPNPLASSGTTSSTSNSSIISSSSVAPSSSTDSSSSSLITSSVENSTSSSTPTSSSVANVTINFVSNQGTTVSSISGEPGTAVSAPTNPTRSGYSFAGWYSDEALTTAYSFTTMPSEAITLYAKWTVNQYTITFVSNGGSVVSSITQDFATAVSAPTNPTRSGYSFAGWYSDEALTTAYSFTTMPSEAITLYAKWTVNQYTITFVSNGGSVVSSITQDFATAVSAPTNPTRSGYSFAGWYSDEALTTAYSFTTMPSEAITLYAKWTVNEYSVTFLGGGDSHSLTVTATGRVYTWGNNSNNELGDGTAIGRRSPTLINFTGLQVGETIQKVTAGQFHSLALTTNGRVYTWGANFNGQLGDGTTTNRSVPTLINFTGLQVGETIQTLVSGQLHSLAITTNGRVYTWGNGGSGQIGDGANSNRSSPTLINFTGLQVGETIQKVSGGAYHSISVTTNGRIFAWGFNGNGELGDGTTTNRLTPTLISLSGLQVGETVQTVIAGSYHSLAVTTNNRVYTWGANGYGQLGSGTTLNRVTPTVIAFTGLQVGETIQNIIAGNFHFLVVTSNSRLFVWGYNGNGQLGDGSTTNRTSPTLISVSGLQIGETIQNVGAGAYHSLALTSNGRLFVWGNNGSGQLGDGTIISKSTPTLVTIQ